MAILRRILPVLLAMVAYQHYVYHNVRKAIGDHLDYLSMDTYTGSHLVTLFKMKPGSDLRTGAQLVKSEAEKFGGRSVYFGNKAAVAYQTSQLDPVEWEVVALTQWPSAEKMQQFVDSAGSSIKGVEAMFHLEIRRNPFMNLLIPIGMGFLKLRALIMGGVLPFTNDPEVMDEGFENSRAKMISLLEPLIDDKEVDASGLVVLNFLKDHPDPEVRSKDKVYSLAMIKMMAEANAGPLHIGTANSVMEGNASWENVALVYYPGVQFMCDMLRSTFIRVGKDKKLGDTLVIFTTPMHV